MGNIYRPTNFVEALFSSGLVFLVMLLTLWGSITPWIFGVTYTATTVRSNGCVNAIASGREREFCRISAKPGESFLVDRRSDRVIHRRPKKVALIVALLVGLVLSLRIRYGSIRYGSQEQN